MSNTECYLLFREVFTLHKQQANQKALIIVYEHGHKMAGDQQFFYPLTCCFYIITFSIFMLLSV